MRKIKLRLFTYILIVIAAALIGYVALLYWRGGESNYEPPQQMSADSREKVLSDLQNLSKAIDAYFVINMEYPQKLELLQPEFLDHVGSDPLSGKAYLYTTGDSGGAGRYRISVPDPALYHAKEFYIENGTFVQR